MKILVTGGFGYLGSHIADYLNHQGHAVSLLARKIPAEMESWSGKFKVYTGDVSEFDSLSGSCNGVDVVIHAAALNDADCRKDSYRAMMVNGYGTRNMLEEASRAGVKKFIYLSTFHVYGAVQTERIDEGTLPVPVGDYGITHYLAELYCQKYQRERGLKTISLRLSNGYGAPLFKEQNCWMLVVNDFCKRAVEEGSILLKSAGTQERDFIAIPDILQAIDLFVRMEDSRISFPAYQVGGKRSISIRDLAGLVAKVYREKHGKTIAVEFDKDVRPAEIQQPFIYDISRIERLGFSPRTAMETEISGLIDFLERTQG